MEPVVRFAVVAHDGRRSAEWRVWTGSRRPSNDTYLAPRQLTSQLKISLHKDGSFQHGPTEPARQQIRSGDRHALDRWTAGPEESPGISIAYILRFYEAHLRTAPELDARTIRVPAPQVGQMLVVALFTTDHRTTEQDPALKDWDEFAVLPRKDHEVILASTKMSYDHEVHESDLKDFAASTGYGWRPHPDLASAPFGWAHGVGWGDIRYVDEFAEDYLDSLFAARTPLHDERFEIRDLSDLPTPLPGDVEVCAVLRLTLLGRAQVYLDQRARCDHTALFEEAASLFADARNDACGTAWDRMEDGSLVSGLTTSEPHQHFHAERPL